MKTTLIACLFILMFAPSSFAKTTHAYLAEDCFSESHEFHYMGNYPIGGYYALSPLGKDVQAILIPADAEDVYDPEEIANMDMLYRASGHQETAPQEDSKDNCFDTTVTFYNQTLTFEKVKEQAGSDVGIEEGQSVKFACRMQLDIPNGESCE